MTAASPSPDLPDDLEAWAGNPPESYGYIELGDYFEQAAAIARALIAERAAHAETRERADVRLDELIDAQRKARDSEQLMRAAMSDTARARQRADAAEAEAKRLRTVLSDTRHNVEEHWPDAPRSAKKSVLARIDDALSPEADPREAVVADPDGASTECREGHGKVCWPTNCAMAGRCLSSGFDAAGEG